MAVKPAIHGRDHNPQGGDPLLWGGWVVVVSDNVNALTTGDGKLDCPIPEEWDGFTLKKAWAYVTTASSSGTPTIQLHNTALSADMLDTKITIDANELHSKTAAVPVVINATNSVVSWGFAVRIDVDVAGTGTLGLKVGMRFEL